MDDNLFTLGALPAGQDRWRFRVWAPKRQRVDLLVTSPQERTVPMTADQRGYYEATVDSLPTGSRYLYRLDGKIERPDPASRFQPDGVHAASAAIDSAFTWDDHAWFGLPLRDYAIYELHVGTFTPEGTFEAIIPHLESLKELGITAIELMPVAQFAGERNWGYDGVYPFAVQNSYGGPVGLKRLINAAHRTGLAVVLDVVYNHLGPEGNYLGDFGYYFTDRYRTPWGSALNFDGPYSDEVRRYFTENALYWQTEFHVDALRLDAVHAIHDFSAVTFLEELAEAVHLQSEKINRRFYLIAETDQNNARLILPQTLGGYGLDAQWSDDFHHTLHVLLTGEKAGYYADFGGIDMLAQVLRDGYAYANKYSASRKRRHGSSPQLTQTRQFVVCSRNHDQIGNRMKGEPLGELVSFEGLKLAASTVLLSPFVPLLFMGEEYADVAPFQYFTSHGDPELVDAVRRGRREEFAAFDWQGEVPDPQDPATFQRSKLNRGLRKHGKHHVLWRYYRELLRLRHELAPLRFAEKDTMRVTESPREQTICIHYWTAQADVFLMLCFAREAKASDLALPQGRWQKILDSAEAQWNGPGSVVPAEITSGERVTTTLPGYSCTLFRRQPAQI